VFSNLKNIFKVEDLRKKVFFTLAMIAVYRFGVSLRVPGVDSGAVAQLKQAAKSQGALGFLNLFSGGAFGSFSIFALGIMPYITASIIMQVLNVVIPKLQEWQEMGAVGQRKITQATRYVAIAIALLQGAGLTSAAVARSPVALQAIFPVLDSVAAAASFVPLPAVATAATAYTAARKLFA